MAPEPNKIIYSMIRVSKYYDKKPVLKDISISYFYGAKIGVLGLNGSGKSSLLRNFAGVDKEFNGTKGQDASRGAEFTLFANQRSQVPPEEAAASETVAAK